jgi:hypothetical protein
MRLMKNIILSLLAVIYVGKVVLVNIGLIHNARLYSAIAAEEKVFRNIGKVIDFI